jgi:hypothetical protein
MTSQCYAERPLRSIGSGTRVIGRSVAASGPQESEFRQRPDRRTGITDVSTMNACTAVPLPRAGERRRDRRLPIRLAVRIRRAAGDRAAVCGVTRDISGGGLRFDAPRGDWRVGDTLDLEVSVPPSEGVWPEASAVSGRAEVLRVVRENSLRRPDQPTPHVSIAARFLGPVELRF